MKDVFDEHRGLLFTVAYELLGSVADAEDIVQDTWFRWTADDRANVHDPKAYLVRITSRLALNRMRTLRNRRESYVGSWLPEPLATSPDPADDVERAEDVSMAMLVVLETLTPHERVVFVLREVFGLPYAEIASTIDRTEASVRQVAHRAREHVQARRPRYEANVDEQRAVTERFLQAAVGGDVAALMEVLAPDVVVVSDSGGKTRANRRPVEGADKVSRFIAGIAGKGDLDGLQVEPLWINGSYGLVGSFGAEIDVACIVEVDRRAVARVLIFRNPDRLTGVGSNRRVKSDVSGSAVERGIDG